MVDDPNKDSQVGPGDKGDQISVDKDDAANGDKKPDKQQKPEAEFVTPTALQGVMDAYKRSTKSELKKFSQDQTALKEQIEALTQAISEKQQQASDGGGKKDKDSKESSELVELRRLVAELKDQVKDSKSRADKERQQRLDQEFKTQVVNALIECGCEKPEEAFLVIRPRLNHDTEEGRIYATVKSDFGDEELDLKTYINRYFREDVLPHVFKGKMRTGAPAGGDSASGGSFEMTKEQAFDLASYMKDPEKHREAIQRGRVKGVTRPGVANSQ